ncbi:hypothetical protein Ddye_023818 [Dipteronia dyeriana]|uniref:Uncharacterized protein n=1 Tax=Dipteronia dyeriana TaxID=168575 RepID=A0AAD9TUL1_9ROSI|nr:hypothetical protein Ddye_023818 [Dipteronia dyeriana]
MYRDDSDVKPASLGEFLEVEQMFRASKKRQDSDDVQGRQRCEAGFEAAAKELKGVVVARSEGEKRVCFMWDDDEDDIGFVGRG